MLENSHSEDLNRPISYRENGDKNLIETHIGLNIDPLLSAAVLQRLAYLEGFMEKLDERTIELRRLLNSHLEMFIQEEMARDEPEHEELYDISHYYISVYDHSLTGYENAVRVACLIKNMSAQDAFWYWSPAEKVLDFAAAPARRALQSFASTTSDPAYLLSSSADILRRMAIDTLNAETLYHHLSVALDWEEIGLMSDEFLKYAYSDVRKILALIIDEVKKRTNYRGELSPRDRDILLDLAEKAIDFENNIATDIYF